MKLPVRDKMCAARATGDPALRTFPANQYAINAAAIVAFQSYDAHVRSFERKSIKRSMKAGEADARAVPLTRFDHEIGHRARSNQASVLTLFLATLIRIHSREILEGRSNIHKKPLLGATAETKSQVSALAGFDGKNLLAHFPSRRNDHARRTPATGYEQYGPGMVQFGAKIFPKSVKNYDRCGLLR